MYKYDHTTAVATRPAVGTAGTGGWFTDGDAATNTPRTILVANFFNMLQAELLAVLAAAGITPAKSNDAQLLAALDARYAHLVTLDNYVPMAMFDGAHMLAQLLLVDGAGCAFDADMLDGQHGAYYAKADDFAASAQVQYFPNGIVEQTVYSTWSTSETSQTVALPIAYSDASTMRVQVTTQIDNASGTTDAIFQEVVSASTGRTALNSVTVMRQAMGGGSNTTQTRACITVRGKV